MAAKMGNSELPNYRTLSTQQLEDMLGRSTRQEEAAIREELDRRYSERIRAEAGSPAEKTKPASKGRNRAGPHEERQHGYQPPPPFMAPPRHEEEQQRGHQPPLMPNNQPRPHYSEFRPTRKNRLAVASLVLGILGFSVLGAIAGLIVGFIALKQIKANNQPGRWLAITGIVVSVLWLLALFGSS
jgi:hypothetical protein